MPQQVTVRCQECEVELAGDSHVPG